jgi:hypothetical protein
MEERNVDGKRKVSIMATVKIPTKVRITYEITDEEHIMPILEQILEQKRRSLELPPPHNGSKKKTIQPPLPKKTSNSKVKRITKN